jgi:hypothetical protein
MIAVRDRTSSGGITVFGMSKSGSAGGLGFDATPARRHHLLTAYRDTPKRRPASEKSQPIRTASIAARIVLRE